MTCKYNIPLEINSNWFLKIHLGKPVLYNTQTSNGHFRRNFRKVYYQSKSKLLSCPSKVWAKGLKLFLHEFSRTMTLVLSSRFASTCWKSSFFKTVMLARNIFPHASQRKTGRISQVAYNYFFLKRGIKANDTFFPFEFHCYFENVFHIKKPSLFLLGVAQPSLLKLDSLYTTKS